MSKIENVSNIFYGTEAVFLVGFPTLATVEKTVDSPEEFYEEKIKPSINSFRLFPKLSLKHSSKLIGSLLEKIPMISQQFEYEDEDEHKFSSASKKKVTSKSSSSDSDGAIVKRTPIYRLYSPSNPVLRQEYTVLSPEIYKKITSKEQEEIMKDKLKEWIDIGYHIHVVQAFKVENQHGKFLIFMEKMKGRTVRDWLQEGFYRDQNKNLNSKRVLNTIVQIAVGLNYIHRRATVHQELIPDHIYVQNDRILKVGNLYNFNGLMSKMNRHCYTGSSPEYWSPEQGSIFEGIKERAKGGSAGYHSALKLLPGINKFSDNYQLGLFILELIFGKRLWDRGDQAPFLEISDRRDEANTNKQTTAFLLDKVQMLTRNKPEDRLEIQDLILSVLDFYAKHFRNPEDLLWARFFDQQKYESDLLNNKAVGLYLSGNQSECERSWMKSLASNSLNLIAQYNYSHFKRMKRIIDDNRLNRDLLMLPESRKRNYFMLISNLVMLPLLRQPFKTYNFNPKLSKHKELEILSNIIQTLDRYKKPKDFIFQKRYHFLHHKFDESHMAQRFYIARSRGTNVFFAFDTEQDIRTYRYIELKASREASPPQGRQAFSCIDPANKYLALSDNSYLCIFTIDPMEDNQIYHQIADYGSSITTMQFDQKSQVLGVGSNQFTIKMLNMLSKEVYKVINIGQKFIIKNLAYYDRNTCISYSYEKSVSFHRIQTTKQLFTIRCNSLVVNYRILEVSVTSHLMIVHTFEKFEIWNIKDKALIRNIEIDQAPKIDGFVAYPSKKIVAHFTKHVLRLWNYANGLILKTYRSPIPFIWIHMDSETKYLRSLDQDGNFIIRCIDFGDFIRNFDGICVPSQICVTDEREDYNDDITIYMKQGRDLIENLNEYRLNQQEKKVSLEKMYRISETIKNTLFYQDKGDIKAIFQYLNGIKHNEDRSSRLNSHSEEYVFMSRKEEFVTSTSNFSDGSWLIGESDGNIRLVSTPDVAHFTIRPKITPVTYLYLQPTSIFIGYQTTCFLVQRESLTIVVTHSSYHKKPIRMGMVLNNILATGDQDQLILFWNKEKVRRYKIPVNLAEIVGKKLIIAGFDNRVRLYDMHPENGVQKTHVFVGHVMSIYNMMVVDDGIFTTYSYDGTIRWWNMQAKSCFSYFNFKKYFPKDKILYVDMPKFSLEEERHAKFTREGCALLLINNSEVVVFDTMRKEVKWRIEFPEDVVKVFWTTYPNTFALVTHEEVRVINVYWRYMMIKRN